ncbi:MAG: hypothetical protein AAGA78_16475, partial [Pseudomonadota bacterium]
KSTFLTHLRALGPYADFIYRWYDTMLSNPPQPMNWALQEKIAQIEDEIWKGAPKELANEIARIEREFAPKVDPTLVKARVVWMFEHVPLVKLTAYSTAAQIEGAIREVCNEEDEDLRVFFDVRDSFQQIATLVSAQPSGSDRERQLERTVLKLIAENQRLKGALEEARRNPKGDLGQKVSRFKALHNALGGWGIYASIVAGSITLLGDDLIVASCTGLSEVVQEFLVAPKVPLPPHPPGVLPNITEV